MKINKLDIAVAVLAGLSCFTMWVGVPVWAIFISWAWYFSLGGKPDAFRQAIPPMLFSYVLGSIAIVAITAAGGSVPVVAVVIAATVFLVMLSVKTKTFACSLASFNAYSCMFAGYYTNSFPRMADSMAFDINNVLVCAVWLALANVIGLVLGYLSILIGGGAAE